MKNEFAHNKMSHDVTDHANGSTYSDHLWQIIHLGAFKNAFVSNCIDQTSSEDKTFVFEKVWTSHQSVEKPA